MHPADLDDGLCTSALARSGIGGDGETRLPFAVDRALLQGGMAHFGRCAAFATSCIVPCCVLVSSPSLAPALSQDTTQESAEAASVRLGSLRGPPQAQLDGFKSHALQVKASVHPEAYASSWDGLESVEGVRWGGAGDRASPIPPRGTAELSRAGRGLPSSDDIGPRCEYVGGRHSRGGGTARAALGCAVVYCLGGGLARAKHCC